MERSRLSNEYSSARSARAMADADPPLDPSAANDAPAPPDGMWSDAYIVFRL